MRQNHEKSNEEQQDKCLLQDFGLFLGFASLSIAEESDGKDIVESVFTWYKKKLFDHLSYEESSQVFEEFREYFYKPRFFFLFGKFDIAVISLVDDFQFASRAFRPYNTSIANIKNRGLKDNKINPPFYRKVISGPTPRFTDNDTAKSISRLVHNDYPLIAITQLKLNDFNLGKIGTAYLRTNIRILHDILNPLRNTRKDFRYVICESYSWNEISLCVFADSYEVCFSIIERVRELTIGEVKEVVTHEKTQKNLKEVMEKCVGKQDSCSLFLSTFTTLGFDFDILEALQSGNREHRGQQLYKSISKKDKIIPFSKWYVKPSQFNRVRNIINANDVSISAGKGDFIFPPLEEIYNGVFTYEFIRQLAETRREKKLIGIVEEIQTTLVSMPRHKDNHAEGKFIPDVLDYNNFVEKFYFHPQEQIETLHKYMEELRIPKVLREGIINAISTYNNHIKSPIYFSSFIELHPFISFLIEKVKEYALNTRGGEEANQENIALAQRHLDQAFHAYMYAFHNRFHSSYITEDMDEFSVFFDGGIHQLITAFGGLYKVITEKFGNPQSLIYLEGDPIFSTSNWALRVNYFHVFHPEKLFAVILQEVGQQTPGRFEPDCPLFHYHSFSKGKNAASKNIENEIIEALPILNEPDYAFLKELITPAFFEHLFADMLGYNLMYLRDFDLYEYWCWGYFCSTPINYYKNQNKYLVREIQFNRFLLRQLVTLYFYDKEKFESYSLSFSSYVDDEYAKKSKIFKKFIVKFLSVESVQDMLSGWDDFIEDEFNTIFSPDLTIDKYRKSETFNERIECIYKNLDVGSVVEIGENEDDFVFIQGLIYAYLTKIKETSCTPQESNHVLFREGEPIGEKFEPKINPSDTVKVLFDPIGGVFIKDAKTRRLIYKYRSVAHMSLWDISVKNRNKYIQDNS